MTLSLFRYPHLQLTLILSCGCFTTAAVVSLSTLAVCLLIVSSFLSYCFISYLCFQPEAEIWRDKINKCWLSLMTSWKRNPTSLIPSRVTSPLVHKEAQKLIQLILRDFVISWFHQISENDELPKEVVRLLEHIALELQTRVQAVDIDALILSLLPLLDPYITALNEVGFVNNRGKQSFDVNHEYCLLLFEKKPHLVHPALKTESSEIEHIQRLVDVFITSAVPSHYKHCDIGVQFVREVLVYRVFHPFVRILCEPDFLLKCIPLILAKASDEKVQTILKQIRLENETLDEQLRNPAGLVSPYVIPPPNETLNERLQNPAGLLSPHVIYPPSPPSNHSHHYYIDSVDYSSVTQSLSLPWANEKQKSLEYQQFRRQQATADTTMTQSLRRNDFLTPVMEDEPQDDLVHVDLPPIYITQHVRVDTKDGIHIGYIIKFQSEILKDRSSVSQYLDESMELESLKRYSDFDKLHKALRTSSLLAMHLKNLTLPDRKILSNIWTKISFSSDEPDPTIILERREGLEKYLQELNNVKEIRDSDLFQEFLLSGVHVLQDAQIVSSKSKQQPRRWSLLGKNTRMSEEDHPVVKHSISEVLTTFTEMHLPIPCQTLLSSETTDGPVVPNVYPIHTNEDTSDTSLPVKTETFWQIILKYMKMFVHVVSMVTLSLFNLKTSHDTHMILAEERTKKSPLMNTLLSLANEVTRTTCPELWLTSEATQLAILGVFGETLDNYMMKELHEVVMDETRWARLLYNLRHLLWPGGNFSVQQHKSISKEEKQQLRNAAIEEIKRFLPNALPFLIGSSTYDQTIEHVLNCIQNPRINRHFLFQVIDILFVQIVPEFHDRDFQKKLAKLRSKPVLISKKTF